MLREFRLRTVSLFYVSKFHLDFYFKLNIKCVIIFKSITLFVLNKTKTKKNRNFVNVFYS